MCLCGDWDPKLVDRKTADRNYQIRMMNDGPRDSRDWGGDMMGGDMGGDMGSPPRIGLLPGLAAGLGMRVGQPRPTESGFDAPHGSRSHAGGGSRRPESRRGDGSRYPSGRHSNMYGGYTRAGRDDSVVSGSFDRRGGPPPARGWMNGGPGGSRGSEGRDRSRSSREPPSRAQAAAMATIRGPMPPGMRMVGRSGSRRLSRSGL